MAGRAHVELPHHQPVAALLEGPRARGRRELRRGGQRLLAFDLHLILCTEQNAGVVVDADLEVLGPGVVAEPHCAVALEQPGVTDPRQVQPRL